MFLDTALAKIFGTKHDRDIKTIQPLVFAVNEWEPKLVPLSDEALRDKTGDLKARLQKMMEDGLSEQEALNDLLPEAFGVAREAVKADARHAPLRRADHRRRRPSRGQDRRDEDR